MSQAAFSAIVSGRVQMVMYRDFTKRNARSLKLLGEVKNLPDGTVSVVAEGPQDKLEALILRMKKGSLLSHVEEVSITWQEPSGRFQGFSIEY